MTARPLSTADVAALFTIVEAALHTSHVRWLTDGGDVVEGTARCIAHDGGGFLSADEDVRDGFLHVSGIGEQWLPVADLIEKVKAGEFAVEDRS